VTNELALSEPYEVTIRCFTPELASVLSGFASSPYGFDVKAVNIEPAPQTVGMDQYGGTPVAMPVAVPVQPQPMGGEGEAMRSRYGRGEDAFRSRYGIRPTTPTPMPMPLPLPGAAAPARTGLQTVLVEKQLKVTLLIHVVRLLPQR
jgi:hypothetical protein